MHEIVSVLPLAFAMMIGPQITASVFLVTSEAPVKNSLAYIASVLTTTAAGTFLAFLLARPLHDTTKFLPEGGSDKSILTYLVVAALVYLTISTFLKRKTSKPPKWMAALEGATVTRALTLGALLIVLMPTDLVVMIGMGEYLTARHLPYETAVPFIVLTGVLAALPLAAYLLFGKAASKRMPAIRHWMSTHAWVISIIIYVFFIYLMLS